MSNEVNDKGWMLHSLAQARRFGPMSEDELRGYFRAGMVKSVDRLTAPGEFAMRSAAEVATMLGEAVPAGPPPPALEELPTPLPSMAVGAAKEAGEDRAARAAAAMNIDIATLMASNVQPQRRSSWLVPIVLVVSLIVMLLFALNMLRRMQGAAAPVAMGPASVPVPVQQDPAVAAPVSPPVAGVRQAEAPPPASAGSAPAQGEDLVFRSRIDQAQVLRVAADWSGLVAFAKQWAQEQPERSEPMHYLGMAYSNLGDHKQAADALQKVVAQDPDNTSATTLLADAYLQDQRWAEAAAIYKVLVAASPGDSRLWNNYGAALSGAGETAPAIAALETAVRLDPGFKQAWTNLGNVYQSSGDQTRASAAYANAR